MWLDAALQRLGDDGEQIGGGHALVSGGRAVGDASNEVRLAEVNRPLEEIILYGDARAFPQGVDAGMPDPQIGVGAAVGVFYGECHIFPFSFRDSLVSSVI